jgi:hypothetical protein
MSLYIVFKKWSLLDISPSHFGYVYIMPYKNIGIFNIVDFNRVIVIHGQLLQCTIKFLL